MKLDGRWKICAFLFFATVLNYMDRQTIGIMAPVLQKDLHFDNAHLGLLFSGFYVTYGISAAVLGGLIDRVKIRLGFAVAVIWWSAATALTGLARGFGQLFSFRMMLGIGEAVNWPATARLVSMYMPPRERTLANSIYMGGGSVGLVIVQPLLIWLSIHHGWRVGFAFIGALSVIWVVAWLYWFRESNTRHLVRYDEGEARRPIAWAEITRVPRFWGLMIASLLGNTCLYFLMNWLPTFLVQDRKFAFNIKFGGVVIIPYLGLDLGYFLSGFAVLWLSKRGMPVLDARRLALISAAILMSSCVIGTPLVESSVLLLILLFGTTLGMAAWNGNYLSAVEEVSAQKVSAVAGITGSVGAFGGAISSWLIGISSQRFGSFTPVFLAVAVMIWLGTIVILLTGDKQHSQSQFQADLRAIPGEI